MFFSTGDRHEQTIEHHLRVGKDEVGGTQVCRTDYSFFHVSAAHRGMQHWCAVSKGPVHAP